MSSVQEHITYWEGFAVFQKDETDNDNNIFSANSIREVESKVENSHSSILHKFKDYTNLYRFKQKNDERYDFRLYRQTQEKLNQAAEYSVNFGTWNFQFNRTASLTYQRSNQGPAVGDTFEFLIQ